MGLFEHFALAAAAGAFVHDSHDIVIGRDDLDRGTVVRDPAFTFTQTQQHAVNAFLGARTGIEIVGEQLVQSSRRLCTTTCFPSKCVCRKTGAT